MDIELVINSSESEISIALLKDKVLTELHSEKGKTEFAVGDVYLGKVKKIIPSLNAAFVDVGYEKDAFLHYLDLGQRFPSLNQYAQESLEGKRASSSLDNFEFLPDIEKEGKIKEVVSTGQQILVQIAKEPISSKGPRLSSEVTLAGRYIVLVPFSNKISLSQRIKDPDERDRLRRLMLSIKPKNFGVIIRTVAENKKVAQLDTDLRNLVERWESLQTTLTRAKPPRKVLGEINKTSAILRDMLNAKFSNIHVNDPVLHEEIKQFLRTISPDQEKIAKLYKGQLGIFEDFGITKQLKQCFGKQVNLKSGAYLIIEHTEAMHVIDVNSGNRKSAGKNQESNALETNMECAVEIARLLRLRDMGGIIVVDFIDMHESANQRALFEKLKECFKDDKAKHNILPPSRFGVVEITRQRVRPETEIKTAENCPTCNGTGEVQSTVLLVDEIENSLRYLMIDQKENVTGISAHPYVAAYLTKGLMSIQVKWFLKYKTWIKISPLNSFQLLEFAFFNSEGKELDC
ncbi:MAG: ribonuclease G [Flavobacteriales bacterium]|jgi:ribonuclease G